MGFWSKTAKGAAAFSIGSRGLESAVNGYMGYESEGMSQIGHAGNTVGGFLMAGGSAYAAFRSGRALGRLGKSMATPDNARRVGRGAMAVGRFVNPLRSPAARGGARITAKSVGWAARMAKAHPGAAVGSALAVAGATAVGYGAYNTGANGS